MHGYGKLTYAAAYTMKDREYYEGEFHRNVPHGKGKIKWFDGTLYEGELANDYPHGKGRIIKPNGMVVENPCAYDYCTIILVHYSYGVFYGLLIKWERHR